MPNFSFLIIKTFLIGFKASMFVKYFVCITKEGSIYPTHFNVFDSHLFLLNTTLTYFQFGN